MKRQPAPVICITSPWNYPLFNPECQTHFGGWEVRIALIAKELARRGRFRVNLIVGDHSQPHVEERHGVTLRSWVGRTIWGIPPPPSPMGSPSREPTFRERVHEKLRRQWRALNARFDRSSPLTGKIGPYSITPDMIGIYDEVDADIYVVPGNSQFSAEMAFYCRLRGKKYVFLAGSDFDYYPEYRLHPERSDMYSVPFALKAYAIESADVHIVQNPRQEGLLRDGYGRSSVIIRNPIDLHPSFPRSSHSDVILWVGKSDERVKQPSKVLELARQLPEFRFVMIMTFAMRQTHEECLQQARQLPNVSVIERVPFEQVESYFANARLHLNTSAFEGFPNTFLQAAKYGVPTASLQVDPGGMLSRHGGGSVCGGDLDALREAVRQYMTDSAFCSAKGEGALNYLREFHDKGRIIPHYEEVFAGLLSRS